MLKEFKKASAKQQQSRPLSTKEQIILLKTSIVLEDDFKEVIGSKYYWKKVSIDFDTKTIQATKDLEFKKYFGIIGIKHLFKLKYDEVFVLD